MASSSVSCMDFSNYSTHEGHSNETLVNYLKYDPRELSASKLLFAEDLVSYIAKNFHGINYEETKTQKCRAKLYKALNDTVKEAATFIRYQFCKTCKLSFDIICGLSQPELFYSDFVEDVLNHNDHSDCPFRAGIFIYYSVYFAELASRCYTKEAPAVLEYAVYSILDCFYKFDCEWSDLQNVAEKIVILSRNPHISLPSRKRKHKKSVEAYPSDIHDESKMDFADNTSSQGSLAIDTQRLTALEFNNSNKDDSIKLPSANIGELRSESTEEKLNFLGIPLSKADVVYLSNLPTEVKTVVTYEATLYATVFMIWDDSEEGSDDKSKSPSPTKESGEMIEAIRQSPVNLKECQSEQIDHLCESFKPGEESEVLQKSDSYYAMQTQMNEEETYKLMAIEDKTQEDMIIRCVPQYWANPGDMVLLAVDRLCFAEELVACIAEFHSIQYTKSWKNPETCENPFNEIIRVAVHFICCQIHESDLIQFETELPTGSKALCFREFFTGILNHYPEGLRAGFFLHYSVYLSDIASHWRNSEFPQALNLAVNFILEAFCTLIDDWEDLYNISKKIVALSNNRDLYAWYKRQRDTSVPSLSKMLDDMLYIKSGVDNPEMTRQIAQNSDASERPKDGSTGLHKDMKDSTFKRARTSAFEISDGDEICSEVHNSGESSSSAADFTTSKQTCDTLSADDAILLSNMALEASIIVRNEVSMFSPLFASRDNGEGKDPCVAKKEYEEQLERLQHVKVYIKDLDEARAAETLAPQGESTQLAEK